MENNFNWFENDFDAELEEFEEKEYKKSTFSSIFDFISKYVNYILLFFIGLKAIWWIFGINQKRFFGFNSAVLINSIVFITGAFTVTNICVRGFVYICLNVNVGSKYEYFLSCYRLVILSFWCLENLSWFKAIEEKIFDSYFFIRAFFTSILITSIAFNATSVLLIFFDKYFVKETLKSKIDDVEKTEKIISSMKNYRYELSSSSTLGTPRCPCQDIFCFDLSSNSQVEYSNRKSLDYLDIKKSYLDIPQPQLHSISDAKTLAKDVFLKASGNGLKITFDEFNAIFSNTQVALSAFTYFDNGIDKSITMKTFHDSIMTFYMERVNLEKSIRRAEEFVSIIGTFFNFVIFIFLFLIYLILFGAPLKELLALALSSALALNFIASGMATDLYYNFMMLLSHQFDIGDEVIVENTEYKVHEFGLTSTSLLCENGGKVKFLNSDLWKKTVINMTRAPEKILVFKFTLNSNISQYDFSALKLEIHNFLIKKKFDFLDTFSLQSVSEEKTGIDKLECSLILKCKTFKNKTKKFNLRVETTHYLKGVIEKYAN